MTGTVLIPHHGLRYMIVEGIPVLQQRYTDTNGREVWKDVPVVAGKPSAE